MDKPEYTDEPTRAQLFAAFEYGWWCWENNIEISGGDIYPSSGKVAYGMQTAFTYGRWEAQKQHRALQDVGKIQTSGNAL